MPSPVTRYTGGEARIAYQLTGTGPALAVTPGWVSHLVLDAGTPEIRAFTSGSRRDAPWPATTSAVLAIPTRSREPRASPSTAR